MNMGKMGDKVAGIHWIWLGLWSWSGLGLAFLFNPAFYSTLHSCILLIPLMLPVKSIGQTALTSPISYGVHCLRRHLHQVCLDCRHAAAIGIRVVICRLVRQLVGRWLQTPTVSCRNLGIVARRLPGIFTVHPTQNGRHRRHRQFIGGCPWSFEDCWRTASADKEKYWLTKSDDKLLPAFVVVYCATARLISRENARTTNKQVLGTEVSKQ